jgi:putative DNA primase/helicase
VVPFDPSRDLGQLLSAIERIGGVSLLVIDPVVSAVTGDSHKNTEVRRALQPLVDLASSCDCAILGITHFAKGGQGTDPAQRVVGSVAFTAVARVVMVAAKVKGDDDERDTRILARTKSNIGPDDGGFQYFLEQADPILGIQASRITWGKSVEGSARELLTDPDDAPSEDTSDTCEMLRAELSAVTWTNAETATLPLKAAGFTKKQIWQASKKVGVERRKDGMKGGWLWRLRTSLDSQFSSCDTEDSGEGSEDSYSRKRESTESSTTQESSTTEVL